ncbi:MULTISPECIES: MipA/OmpV family protein [unclassified Duganella]|uniref:MipA/OmpV family protein n=1 Tax=unclassified Duganella TaxID=2636909 RepID=UPI00138F49E1|nr:MULTISPECIES: MipA/OmpV family protein [unclassified Duganella]
MKLPVSFLILACCTSIQAQENTFTLGGGLAATSRYAGSREMQLVPVVVLDYQMANGFYASSMRGLGYGTALGDFSLDAALGVRGERLEKNESSVIGSRGSTELRGMGDVKASATANLRAGFSIVPGLVIGASASLPLSHKENGKTAGLEISGVLHEDKSDKVALSLGANFADSKYMQTYHGVTAAQAARTAYKKYTPKAGMYQAVLNFAWAHRVDQNWTLTGMLGSSTLVREAARSPLTRRNTAPTAAFYASYRY